MSQHVDCIILAGSIFIDKDDSNNKYIYKAADSVPIMLLNANLDHKNIYCISCDDSAAMEKATEFLLDNKRNNILYLYNSNSYSATKKLSGYRKAFEKRGLKCNEDYIRYFNGTSKDLEKVCGFVTELADKGLKFNGVVASEDFLAVGALKYAVRKGIKVPKDLEIIGYNNSVLTVCTEPELSSVDNQLETLCTNLVRICIGALSGESMPQKTVFNGELIHRSTSASSRKTK